MTFLIIGGLLAVALLAILGAILLGMSAQRSEKVQTNGVTTLSLPPPGSMPVAQQQPTMRLALDRNTRITQNLSSAAERSLRPTDEHQQPYALNGQFRELALELRTLHQEARDLERRLRNLSEIADRIEQTQNNQVSFAEEKRTQPPAESTTM